MEGKIEAYKRILKMLDVPQIIIDNPEMLFSIPTSKDMAWAQKSLDEYLKKTK